MPSPFIIADRNQRPKQHQLTPHLVGGALPTSDREWRWVYLREGTMIPEEVVWRPATSGLYEFTA
jgi:hypothetical protein